MTWQSWLTLIVTALPGPIMIWGGVSFGGGEYAVYAGLVWLALWGYYWRPAFKALLWGR